MSTVLSEVCQSAEICERVTARYLLIKDNHINNCRQCGIFSAEHISAPDPTELHWVICNMCFVKAVLEEGTCIFVLLSLKVIVTAVPFC